MERDMLTTMKNYSEEQPETLEAMLNIFETIRQTEQQWEKSIRSLPAYQRTRAKFIASARKKRNQVRKRDVPVSDF